MRLARHAARKPIDRFWKTLPRDSRVKYRGTYAGTANEKQIGASEPNRYAGIGPDGGGARTGIVAPDGFPRCEPFRLRNLAAA
jgi:hypothetical protein